MRRRVRLTLVLCVAALGMVFAGCSGAGYGTGVYVGVSGPGPYYGGAMVGRTVEATGGRAGQAAEW